MTEYSRQEYLQCHKLDTVNRLNLDAQSVLELELFVLGNCIVRQIDSVTVEQFYS